MSGPAPSDAIPDDAGGGSGGADGLLDEHEAAEGAESSGRLGSSSTLREMLLSTEPATPLDEVGSPWDPERGGVTRVYRGLQKMLGFDGTPAIVDVVLGLAEFIVRFEPEEPDEEPDPQGPVPGGQPPAAGGEGSDLV